MSIYSISGIFSLAATVIVVILFLLLYINRFESNITLFFIIVLLTASMVSLGQIMIYNAGTHSNGIFRQKFEHAAFSIVVPLWVIFVNLLSKNKKKLFYYSVLFSISIANIILIIFSDLFITQTLLI